jgi:hypothetical protein
MPPSSLPETLCPENPALGIVGMARPQQYPSLNQNEYCRFNPER